MVINNMATVTVKKWDMHRHPCITILYVQKTQYYHALLEEKVLYRTYIISAMYLEPLKGSIHS